LGAGSGGQRLDQRGLPGLPGAVEQHYRGIGHRLLLDGVFNVSPDHGEIFTSLW
jgi:hypothetical protein